MVPTSYIIVQVKNGDGADINIYVLLRRHFSKRFRISGKSWKIISRVLIMFINSRTETV